MSKQGFLIPCVACVVLSSALFVCPPASTPPTVAFTASPTNGEAPVTAQFTDHSTSGTAAITSWSWTFGDGGTSNLQHPSHTDADLTGDGRKGNLWNALTGKVAAARAAAPCQAMGFVWMQGGKDMQVPEAGRNYLENLRALVEGLRKETGVADLPFLCGSYREGALPDDLSAFNPEAYTGITARPAGGYVLKAQWDAQTAPAPAATVLRHRLPRHDENVQYNTEGQLQLGRLFAQAYLAHPEWQEALR